MKITEEDIVPSNLNNLCDKLMDLSPAQIDLLDHAVYAVKTEMDFYEEDEKEDESCQ